MKQITRANYKEVPGGPEGFAAFLAAGGGIIIEKSIEGLIEIIQYIASAAKNGPRIKRIVALEESRLVQTEVNERILLKLDELEKRMDEYEIKKLSGQ